MRTVHVPPAPRPHRTSPSARHYIGGSQALIAELPAAPELEAHPVAPGDEVG
ncbi:hypothetical protein ACFW9O_02910 [Streptomyces sp. NPDC059499]|uniref:hypothetical protein n=1 Tax=Streptomyces sp. NPDC059499 TaxID=3346852 RepID=UPI00367E2315